MRTGSTPRRFSSSRRFCLERIPPRQCEVNNLERLNSMTQFAISRAESGLALTGSCRACSVDKCLTTKPNPAIERARRGENHKRHSGKDDQVDDADICQNRKLRAAQHRGQITQPQGRISVASELGAGSIPARANHLRRLAEPAKWSALGGGVFSFSGPRRTSACQNPIEMPPCCNLLEVAMETLTMSRKEQKWLELLSWVRRGELKLAKARFGWP